MKDKTIRPNEVAAAMFKKQNVEMGTNVVNMERGAFALRIDVNTVLQKNDNSTFTAVYDAKEKKMGGKVSTDLFEVALDEKGAITQVDAKMGMFSSGVTSDGRIVFSASSGDDVYSTSSIYFDPGAVVDGTSEFFSRVGRGLHDAIFKPSTPSPYMTPPLFPSILPWFSW